MEDKLTRRQFIRESAVAGAAIGAGIGFSNSTSAKNTVKILNYNPDMEYRRRDIPQAKGYVPVYTLLIPKSVEGMIGLIATLMILHLRGTVTRLSADASRSASIMWMRALVMRSWPMQKR